METSTRTRAAGPRPTRVTIRARQMHLPAGFLADGRRPATLRQVVSPATPTLDGARLTDRQRDALAMMRIRRQKRFRMMALGGGVIGKRRALEEIRQRSAIGRALVEIEHIAI